MRYVLNIEWTQARINEAAERGDMEQVRILVDDYYRRVRHNQWTDVIDRLIPMLRKEQKSK